MLEPHTLAPPADGGRPALSGTPRDGQRRTLPRPGAADGGPRFRWWRRHAVRTACVATAAVHLLSLTRRLVADEGGFAMVARHWNSPGAYLYGPQWVDRPPGLLGVFALADHLGPYGVRLVAALVAVALVAAVSLAARAAAGPTAAAWSAWAAFAFASSALLDAQQLNGELVAAAFVSVSFAGLLLSLRPEAARPLAALSAGLAGAAAATAVLTKQNFVDGLAFAVVVLGVHMVRPTAARVGRRGRLFLVAGAFGLGSVTVAGVAALWAAHHGGVSRLLYAMYGFRRDAGEVIVSWSWSAPLQRLGLLSAAVVVSGLAVLGALLLSTHRSRLAGLSPVPTALAVAGLVEVAGVVGGGNFWLHYAIGTVPTIALAAGLAARPGQRAARRARSVVVYAALVTAVVSPAAALVAAHTPSAPFTTGRWLAHSSRPGDTLVVPYTHANVIEASGLTPVYPYSWSLPARTLDPHLDLLVRTLDSSARPTWVVVWDDLQLWGLDGRHRVERALAAHYRPVASVCGHRVWLRDHVDRSPAAGPPPGAC